MWKYYEKAQFQHSFDESPETMRKLCLSTEFSHQEIRWKFRSDFYLSKVAHLDSSLHKKRSFPLKISLHCVKSVQIRSFSWSEYRKIRTRKNSVFGHFLRSVSNPYWKTLNGKETLNTKLHFLCFASWIHINCFFLIYTSARYILAATIWIKQILLIIIHHTSTHQSWMLY